MIRVRSKQGRACLDSGDYSRRRCRPITNAMSEGPNRQIQKIKSMTCGFPDIEHFKTAISFHCGWLDLYPR
ncbi:MAG: transposase [Nitrospira sp.]|nr:transposase [Nitrospira sp.]